jgi:phage nucleotide-binding protein
MGMITKPGDIRQSTLIKGLIYGQPGIGKSTLAASAPAPVCIDADRGMHRVEAQHRIPTLEVKSYQQVLDFLSSPEVSEYETMVFDTIGELIGLMDPHIVKGNPKMGKRDGALTLQGYGVRKTEFKRLLTIIASKGKHVVFVAHEKEEKTNSGDARICRPDMPGSSGADIIKLLDFVGYMQSLGERRTIQFSPTEKFYAKNSLGLERYIELPDTKEGNIFISENIIKMTTKRLAEQAQIHKNYNALLANITETLAAVKNAKTLNAAVSEIKEIPPVWDSHIRVRSILRDTAQRVTATFDKKTKKYVAQKTEKVEELAGAKNAKV